MKTPLFSFYRSFFALLFCLISIAGWGQVSIVSDGLNNSSSVFTLNGGLFYTGNSGTADRPASIPFAFEGTHAFGVTNGTATLTTPDINTSAYSNIKLTFKLASFSIGSTGNGADAGDIVNVEISPNAGANYYSTIRVLGNSNAYWAYSATGNASTAYDENTTPTDFVPAGGGSRTSDGFSTVSVTNLPTVSSLRVRITMLNNATGERWVIDDFKMTGTAAINHPEPSNHPTLFSCGTANVTSIPLTWSDAAGGTLPTGYLVKWSSVSFADITAPIDGVSQSNGAGVQNVTGGVQSSNVTGLTPNTPYYFKIWPYTNSGTNINYKTDGAIQQTNCTTLNGPCYTGNAPAFPTLVNTFPGDSDSGGSPTNTVRLASGSGGGSATTVSTGVSAGDVTVRFRAKAWSDTETQVTVQVGGQSILYTGLTSSFAWHEVTFTEVSGNPTLTFSTITDKRLHLGNIEIHCTPSIPKPIISVTPSGNYAFGSQVVSTSSTPAAFTIKNTGTLDLTIGTFSLSNSNADQFTVSQTAATTLAPNATATFTATFTPTSTGAKTATVTIPNNTGTPYTFNITGTGALNAVPNNGLNLNTGACIANNQIKLNWSAASGGATGYIVYALAGTTAPAIAAASAGNASSYTANSDFSAATSYGTLGKAVYKGSGTTATITGLTQGQQYTFKVVAYNGETATGWSNSINSTSGTSIASYTIKVPEIGNPVATVAPTSSVVSWNVVPASSGCYEYLVLASQGAVTFTPSGDGSAYSANTVLSGNNQVVYKAGGTGNTVTVTGLTEGLQYCYKIFVRELNTNQWSAGAEICTTTGLNYCASASTTSTDNGITAVEFNTISNISAVTESYTDFTGVSTTVTIGETYELSVRVKTYFSNTNYVKAWIDWNRNESFESGEDYDLGTAKNTADGYTSNSPLNIRVPSGSATGNVRMRIISKEGAIPTACTDYPYGETEDYTITIAKPANAEINVKGGSISIPSGSTEVNGLNNTEFAATDVGSSSLEKTFTIENLGQNTLNLTGSPLIKLQGDHPADFTVTVQPAAAAIGINGSLTFKVKFNPTTADVRSTVVSISNDDPTGSENPYTFRLQGKGQCGAVPVISMLPTSGPANTVVTLTSAVNDLTGAEIKLNGVTLIPVSVNTGEIKIIIPAGAYDGNITVRLKTGCVFSQAFDVLSNEVTACEGSGTSTVPSDLFISEVTDSNTGGLTYIEIYNGTGSTKNMSTYTLNLYNNGSTIQNGGTVALNNVELASGSTYVVAVGGSECDGDGTLADQVSLMGGFNFGIGGNDHIRLYNATSYVDAFGVYENGNWSGNMIGTKGGTFRRKANAVAIPTTIFNLSDWEVIDFADDGGCVANDYADVGIYNFSVPIPPAITAQPVFTPTCQSIQLTVSAGEGVAGGNGLAYQWYALAPGASTWTPVSDSGVYSGAATHTLTISSATGLDHYQYYAQARENTATCYTASSAVQIRDTETKWTATGWTNGLPSLTSKVVLERNYDTAVEGDLTACSLEIKNGYELKVRSGTLVTVAYQITNHSTPDKVVVENEGNLIQTQDSAPNNTGAVTVRRNAKMKRLDYTYWSAPVAAQNLKEFSPGTLNNRFYIYNEWDDKFTGVDPLTNNFAAAKGYAIRASNLYPAATATVPAPVQNFEGVFKGVPNNGLQNFLLEKSSAGNGFNLVGNPYPSNIDFFALADRNQDMIHKTAYFWTNMNPNPAMQGSNYPIPVAGVIYYNNYAVLNGTGGIPATINSVDPKDSNAIKSATPTQYIKVGQGFIVQAKNGGDLEFSNAVRNAAAGSVFFNNRQTNGQPEAIDRFWLHLETPLKVLTTALIGYLPSATIGVDADYDSKLLVLGSDALYSQLGDLKLGIQGKPSFTVSDTVPLGTSHDSAGTFTFYLGQKEGVFAAGQQIFLRDRQTGTVTNLSEENYKFTAEKGLTENRFEIVYRKETALGTGNPVQDDLLVFRSGTDFVIRSAVKKIAALEVYDMSGKLVLSQLPNRTEFRIDASALVNGVYLLKINRNGEWVNRKISR